jgi:hypothetical protein
MSGVSKTEWHAISRLVIAALGALKSGEDPELRNAVKIAAKLLHDLHLQCVSPIIKTEFIVQDVTSVTHQIFERPDTQVTFRRLMFADDSSREPYSVLIRGPMDHRLYSEASARYGIEISRVGE